MEKSQLSQLVFSFSTQEKKEVRKFLESPYFNQRRDVLALFDWFCAGEPLEKTAAKRRVFGDDSPDDQELRLRMTYLSRLLERYIAQKEFEADDNNRRMHLLVGLRKRGLVQTFERARRQLENTLESGSLRDVQYHELQYRLHWETHQLAHQRNLTDVDHLLRASDQADQAYLALKLRLICLSMAHRGVYSAEMQTERENEVVLLAEKSATPDTPAIATYLHCYRMMRYPEQEEHFQAFKQQLLYSGGYFSPTETHSLFIWAVNYCVRKLNAGEKRFIADAYELYKAGLDKGVLLENGVLSRFTYHNIVAAGIQTGDHDWVSQFIHEYKNHLEKPWRESAFCFNLARLEFARQRYQAVLELLQKANYRDVLVNLSTKALLLKTWYELDEYDLLQSNLDALQNYIRRKRVIGYHHRNYMNFIRYLGKLIAVGHQSAAARAKLAAAIAAEEHLAEKDWLLQKSKG